MIRGLLLFILFIMHVLLLRVFTCHIRVNSESTFYNCLTVKEPLARDICRLTDFNGTRTNSYLPYFVNKHSTIGQTE